MDATKQYIVTTIVGFGLLAIWLASVLATPLIVLDPAVQTVIFGLAIGALGIQTYTGYKTASENSTLRRDIKSW